MSTRLSVCVIARDEAENLARCLDSAAFADEIIVVVDERSCDETEAIARKRATTVERRRYEGDIEQKRYCVELAGNDWILIVDPDEVITQALAESIRGELEAVPRDVSAFSANRVTYHMGRWIRHGDFYPDWKERLFRRSRSRFAGRNPHGRVEVEGEIVRISGEIEHYSYRDLADQIERVQSFSTQAADALFLEGRPARWRDLTLRPPARFVRAYMLKQGFRDGVPGFVIAAVTGFYVFLKYAKLWERERRPGSRPTGSK